MTWVIWEAVIKDAIGLSTLRERRMEFAVVKSIEYDPNRSARIALLYYADGAKSYIIAPNGLKVGSTVMSGKHAALKSEMHCPCR